MSTQDSPARGRVKIECRNDLAFAIIGMIVIAIVIVVVVGVGADAGAGGDGHRGGAHGGGGGARENCNGCNLTGFRHDPSAGGSSAFLV